MNRDTSRRLVFFSRDIQPGLGDKKNKKEGTQKKKARSGLCCGYFSDHEQARLHRFPGVSRGDSSRGAEVNGESRVRIEKVMRLAWSTNSL